MILNGFFLVLIVFERVLSVRILFFVSVLFILVRFCVDVSRFLLLNLYFVDMFFSMCMWFRLLNMLVVLFVFV